MDEAFESTENLVPTTFLTGGGTMGHLIRSFDWSRTAIGPVEFWPQSLRSALSICLNSSFPIAIYWGRELTLLYNDDWSPIPGEKHPWALGRPAREAWSEIWEIIDPLFRQVVTTGEAIRSRDQLLPMRRHGFTEECYFDYSFSPIRGESGEVAGIFNAVIETTQRVIGERRLRTLRELAGWKTGQSRSAEEACRSAALILADNPLDLPFSLIYLLDEDGLRVTLVGQSGLSEQSWAGPAAITLDAPDSWWPLRQVADSGKAVEVANLPEKLGSLLQASWPESPHQAVVLPMTRPGQAQPAGFVVAGISPRLSFDDEYKGFTDLLAGHLASAVASARAYEEERRRAEALAELDRAKTAFFSNVSHEFRTPLTLMLGPVEDLLSGPIDQLPPGHRELLTLVNRNGRRLLRLVNSLLDFSRIEAGRVRAEYRATDLAAYTVDLASVFRSACDRAGLTLTVDCPANDEPVFVDREMWEKIVLNLLSNAFKFTFKGGISVRTRQNAHTVELEIEDTGVGIAEEELPRLFERFHRIENTGGRTHEGSGIGLALIQELTKLHGGSISAESVVGQGTTFRVTLLLGQAHLPEDQIKAGPGLIAIGTEIGSYVEEAVRWLPEQNGQNGLDDESRSEPEPRSAPPSLLPEEVGGIDLPLILIADDNADMRGYLTRLLARGHRVESVADGQEALTAVRQRLPDLILTDVMMPRLDGFGLLRELRADPRTRAVPVIMLSARAGEESRVEGMRAGADDYLVKPFASQELLARIAAHLQMARIRREANESLRQGEERLRMALAAARMVAWQWEPDTGLLHVSDNAVDVFGLTSDTGLTAIEEGVSLLHPDDVEGYRGTFNRAIEERGSYFTNYRLIRPIDGTILHMEERGNVVCDASGQVVRLVGVVMDISERRRSEELTLLRSEQLRKLAEVAGRINAAQDVVSVCRIITEQARLLIGSHQSVIGYAPDQNWSEAVRAVSLSDKYARWRDYQDSPADSGIYTLVCRRNRPIRLSQDELEIHPSLWFGPETLNQPPLRGWLAAPLVARDGRNIGLIQLSDKFEGEFTEDDEAVLVQLAQMASVAIENARLVEDLRDADHRKNEFLAILAHELRNPLAPVRNGLQIMRLAGEDRAVVEEARLLMERQVTHMVRLIYDLMDVSRITRNKLELRPMRVELAEIARNAIDASRTLIESAGHHLTVILPARAITIEGDPTRLAQVFSNLLNNAAKYTEAGGEIALVAETVPGEVIVTVRDNGVGIPAEMLSTIFGMFTQVDRSLERSQGGLGIGLTLVRRLVEMHGGSVEARSPGQGLGSEFLVRLPMVADDRVASGDPDPGSDSKVRLKVLRILVVDDNQDSARTLARLLKLLGHETRLANDGGEAVLAAEAYRPEVILLDIGLPVMNGYDVAKTIRARPWGQTMSIVALTGWGQAGDRERSKEAGFDHHLVKPVDITLLEKLLLDLRTDPEATVSVVH